MAPAPHSLLVLDTALGAAQILQQRDKIFSAEIKEFDVLDPVDEVATVTIGVEALVDGVQVRGLVGVVHLVKLHSPGGQWGHGLQLHVTNDQGVVTYMLITNVGRCLFLVLINS